MTARTSLLRRPAATHAREHALALLQAVHAAQKRLRGHADPESLHDFRVALRRLRSWLQAYRDYLPVRRKLVRRLRRLAKETNSARDLEVTIAHLKALRRDRCGKIDSGDWHAVDEALAHHLRDAQRAARDAARIWPKLELAIEGELGAAIGASLEADFGQACAERLSAQQAAVERCMSGEDDIRARHRLRIEIKRLRYLLDPLRETIPKARKIAKSLADFQDGIGTHRDLELVIERLRGLYEEAATHHALKRFDKAVGSGRGGHRRSGADALLELARAAAEACSELEADWADDGLRKKLRKVLRDLTPLIGRLPRRAQGSPAR